MYKGSGKHIENTSNPELPDAELERRERSGVLYKAIDKLPKKQKTAFVLNKYDKLSYKEISEVMNKSISSVESLLFRAKKNLQEKLVNYYKENF
jgi:RNA polymerase sigma-70 factor (ECF subfamily)